MSDKPITTDTIKQKGLVTLRRPGPITKINARMSTGGKAPRRKPIIIIISSDSESCESFYLDDSNSYESETSD